jgi:DNA repair protein RadC
MNQFTILEIEKGNLSESSSLSEILHNVVSNANISDLKKLDELRPIELFNLSESDFVRLGFTKTNSKRLYSMTLLFKKFKTFDSNLTQIRSSNDAKKCFDFLRTLPHEELWVVYLDAKSHIIKKEKVGQGSINECVFPSKLIMKNAISCNASSVLVGHNHPSGNPLPSKSDIDMTKKMIDMSEIADIHFLDHIIVGSDSNISLKEMKFV